MELSHARINFLGDSITYGCGADSPEKGFVSLIAQETGADCRNYGVIGTRIARQKQPSECSAFDEDFCQRAEKWMCAQMQSSFLAALMTSAMETRPLAAMPTELLTLFRERSTPCFPR